MRALVRSSTGYRYHGGSVGDDHIYTSHPEYTDDDAVNTVVDAELEEATDDASTVAIVADVLPRNGDDAPYEDFGIGDAVEFPDIDRTRDSFRTMSIKVQESSLAVVRYGLEVNSRLDDDIARQERWLEMATPGSLSGRSDQISAADLGAGVPFTTMNVGELGSYQQSGALVAELDYDDPEDDGHSDDWPVDEPILIYRVRYSLQQAGDTDTIVHLRLNGGGPFDRSGVPFFHEIIIPAGETVPDDDTNDGMYTNQVANKGDKVRCATYQAGDFARGLVVRVKYTTQT